MRIAAIGRRVDTTGLPPEIEAEIGAGVARGDAVEAEVDAIGAMHFIHGPFF